MRGKLVLLLLLTLVSPVSAQRLVVGQPVMRAGEDMNSAEVAQYGPRDTIFAHIQFNGLELGMAISAIWYGPTGEVEYRQTYKVDQENLTTAARTRGSFFFSTAPKSSWPLGAYRLDLVVDGRIVQRARFMVGDRRMLSGQSRPPDRVQEPQVRYDAQAITGRWVFLRNENGRSIVCYNLVEPNGSYQILAGSRVLISGVVGIASNGRIAWRPVNHDVVYGTYELRGSAWTVRSLDGSFLVTYYREGSAEALALVRRGQPVAVTSPTPPAVETTPQRVESLQVTGTFKFSSRDQGPHEPTTRFGAYDDIHCGIRGSVKKGSKIEALLRDRDGREVMKMSLAPMPGDTHIDKYAIPFRHPTRALPPGEYTVQVLLNDQDVGKPLKITVNGTVAAVPSGHVEQTAPSQNSMRDLVKVETASAITTAKSHPGQRYALLIGVGQYDNNGVQPLKFPVDDVRALREVLENPHSGGFDRANVHVLTNSQATLAGIGEQLVWLRGISTPADTVFIYFTGHGYNNGSRSYLGTANTDPDNLNFTALSVAKFNEAVSLIKARKKVIVLDACHSGGMLIAARGDDKLTPQMLRELHERAEGEVRLLSCSQNETSKEDSQLGHGVFTWFLLKGMGPELAADANHDGVVTVGELYEYLSQQVRKYGAEHGYIQTPSAEQKVTGGVIIMSTKWK